MIQPIPATGGKHVEVIVRADITLSVNRALWGEVFPELVGVTCQLHGPSAFELVFFVDAPIVEEWVEQICCIETEVIADFPADVEISHRIVETDQVSTSGDGFLIFLRKRNRYRFNG